MILPLFVVLVSAISAIGCLGLSWRIRILQASGVEKRALVTQPIFPLAFSRVLKVAFGVIAVYGILRLVLHLAAMNWSSAAWTAAASKIAWTVLVLQGVWAVAVIIDRLLAYSAARKQSRAFAPAVAGALRDGRLDEAVRIAGDYRSSHLAKVVVAGLEEFQASQRRSETPGEKIEASKRALERAEVIVHAELTQRISALATIASTAPFVGLFGTVIAIINSFRNISTEKSAGLGAVAGGISEALLATAIGLLVAIPAIWMFKYLTARIGAFDVEMDKSSSELIDYFNRRTAAQKEGSA